jgi:hypothetical protein
MKSLFSQISDIHAQGRSPVEWRAVNFWEIDCGKNSRKGLDSAALSQTILRRF